MPDFNSVLLVYNHQSGLKLGSKFINLIQKKLVRHFHNVANYQLTDWSDEIFKKYGQQKFDLVVAVGGDGTVRTCAKLILNYLPTAGLKIIPAGSTNVLAHSLKLSRSLIKNINRLDKIGEWRQINIDVGVLNNNYYFLDAVIIGYLAKVIAATDQKLKNLFGFGGYLINFLRPVKPHLNSYNLKIDGQEKKHLTSTLIIANTLNIFGFSPHQIRDFTDGKLEVMPLGANNFFSFFKGIWHFFLFKNHSKRSLAKKITIVPEAHHALPIQIDGDPITNINPPYQLTILPQALKIWL